MMAQSRAVSTRDTYNYGQYLNQFPPNTIKVIREFERIQKRICRRKMSIMFNEICIYIYIYIYICVKPYFRKAFVFRWICMREGRSHGFVCAIISEITGKKKVCIGKSEDPLERNIRWCFNTEINLNTCAMPARKYFCVTRHYIWLIYVHQ